MRCEECTAAGVAHQVERGMMVNQPMGGARMFWDEQNVHHIHDGDRISQGYRCSNGHRWGMTLPARRCPAGTACEWNQKREI